MQSAGCLYMAVIWNWATVLILEFSWTSYILQYLNVNSVSVIKWYPSLAYTDVNGLIGSIHDVKKNADD